MSPRTLKEVNTPYVVNPEDEALGRDTIVIRRNGEPVAVIMPYAEYTELTAGHYTATFEFVATHPDFERDRAAFRRLLSELLETPHIYKIGAPRIVRS